jgi:two-component system phosphate regulon response regulator PhoB
MRTKILVIDDEESLCEILKFSLLKEGYDVDTALSAEEALMKDLPSYSLFIVDIMMDRMSGFDFARAAKNIQGVENAPMIFCSALVGEDDKVMGLNIGADDYITKPFVINEVLARVRAVLRRAAITGRNAMPETTPAVAQMATHDSYEADIRFKDLIIDRNAKVCFLEGRDIQLTRTEYDLLLFFLTHPNRIYSREEIIKKVWANDVIISNRTIDTNITRLRKKIGDYGAYITTRQGFGYGFKDKI